MAKLYQGTSRTLKVCRQLYVELLELNGLEFDIIADVHTHIIFIR